LVNIVEQADSVVLEFANGRIEHADLVVGADGVRSTVRRWVTGADDAIYSGTSAFRGIVPVENLPSLPDPQAIQFWMGPDAHVLHYAIGGNGDAVNFFAVVETPRMWMDEGSVVEVGEEVPVASFRG
jgi:salicylate hydroxylase